MKKPKIIKLINERIEELKQDWKEEPNKDKNHMASMIIGEIDGLVWCKEQIEEIIEEGKT